MYLKKEKLRKDLLQCYKKNKTDKLVELPNIIFFSKRIKK